MQSENRILDIHLLQRELDGDGVFFSIESYDDKVWEENDLRNASIYRKKITGTSMDQLESKIEMRECTEKGFKDKVITGKLAKLEL